MAPATPSHACPARSRRHAPRTHLVFSALFVLVSLSSTVLARHGTYPPEITAPASLDLAASELVIDTRGHFSAEGELPTLNDDNELRRRQSDEDEDDDGKSSSDKTKEEDSKTSDDDTKTTKEEKESTKTKSEDSKATKTVTDEASGPLNTVSQTSTATEAAATSPLPSAFDLTPSSDFKSLGGDDSCPSFVSNLLASSTYKDCYPLSMMMQTSSGLFDAEGQLTSIVRVLDATCAADVEACTEFFEETARNLTTEANCKKEFDDGLTLVTQVYQGLRAYEMLYSASCLQDPDTDMYCFASSVTNTTQPSDFYFYFMPLGLGLPGGSTPSCGWCTTETMGIWHSATADRSQAISDVYVQTAQQVNTVCGPDSVNGTLAEEESAAGHDFMPASMVMIATICATVLLHSVL